MKIFDQEIQPGEHRIVRIPAPKLYNFTPVFLPVHVIRGNKPGPTLCLTAAIHGDEVNGVEIIRRLLKKSFIHSLAGTLIAVPVVDTYGFLFQDRYLPDRRDLNRAFPGSEKGSLASRFAYLLTQTVVVHATHCIDLHTGSLKRTNLPQIRIDENTPQVTALAEAFGASVILFAPPRKGSFREYARQKGIPYLLYEAGEASRFDENCILTGVAGIVRVMQHLSMLPNSVLPKHQETAMIAHSSYWVRSPFGGIFIATQELGHHIEKGDVLGIVAHPADAEEYKIISPIAGVIIGRCDAPLIHEGAGVFHIACLQQSPPVADKIQWLEELNDVDKDEEDAFEIQLDG